MMTRLLRLGALVGVAVPVITVLATAAALSVQTPTATSTLSAPNAMAVDADAGDADIDAVRGVSGGSPFVVSVNITQAGEAYHGYNARLQYDDSVLEFVPTSDLNSDTTNESWDYTGLGGMVLDTVVSRSDGDGDTVLDRALGGSGALSSTSTTGAAANVTFKCIADGSSELHLVTFSEVSIQWTTTLDGLGGPIGTLLSDATISCSQAVGGIAELPDAAGAPLEAGDSSGRNIGLLAGVVAAGAAAASALGGAAWYARRRWLS